MQLEAAKFLHLSAAIIFYIIMHQMTMQVCRWASRKWSAESAVSLCKTLFRLVSPFFVAFLFYHTNKAKRRLNFGLLPFPQVFRNINPHTRFTISTEKGDDMSVLFLRRCDAATMDMFMFARSDHFCCSGLHFQRPRTVNIEDSLGGRDTKRMLMSLLCLLQHYCLLKSDIL